MFRCLVPRLLQTLVAAAFCSTLWGFYALSRGARGRAQRPSGGDIMKVACHVHLRTSTVRGARSAAEVHAVPPNLVFTYVLLPDTRLRPRASS